MEIIINHLEALLTVVAFLGGSAFFFARIAGRKDTRANDIRKWG